MESFSIPKKTLDAFDDDELRARVFFEKYALRDTDGVPMETTPDQMWRRVANEIASTEKETKRQEVADDFDWLMSDWKFIPGGRIMFGAGQPRHNTLLNCYVNAIREDSIEAIFDWCKEAARTYSYGGGVGVDISILRPKGAPVNNSAFKSTGSVSFMDIMSMTTGTIGQAGRRGALMITMRVDHPDIEDFITIKQTPGRVTYANVSVRVTDEFMQAVEANGPFTLRFKTDKAEMSRVVQARAIWKKLVESAWKSAEPGIIFWDTLIHNSTTTYNGMVPLSTNPCGEVPLEDGGCCCLGSINLSQFVTLPFTRDATIDTPNLEKAIKLGVRFLDDVLDYNLSKHPLPIQQKASMWSRRIGLGITGLADMLIKLGIKYDSDVALTIADGLMSWFKETAYNASVDLAEEKGVFTGYETKHLVQPFIQSLSKKTQERIAKSGIRNATVMTVPPVGSGSVLAGSSSGIEPVFALSYKRRSKSLSQEEFSVVHPLIKEWSKYAGVGDYTAEGYALPAYFVSAHQINPEFRVRMQAAIQKHVDQSISSTVNLPRGISLKEVEMVFFLAWKLGCKGITVYREGSREGILETL
jgi:ribonucleoside-diphosphate reductase alpha chain